MQIAIKISLKFVPRGPINNIPALVQIMAWRWPGDKPLSEPTIIKLLTHICIPQPQWVKAKEIVKKYWEFSFEPCSCSHMKLSYSTIGFIVHYYTNEIIFFHRIRVPLPSLSYQSSDIVPYTMWPIISILHAMSGLLCLNAAGGNCLP